MLNFAKTFAELTDHAPFPWQQDLYDNWFAQGKIPKACNLPTGLGKTSVIAIWLIALANFPKKMPRRLVYVVNRRTVVDQTTDEVEKYRDRLPDIPELFDRLLELCANEGIFPYRPQPLAISTLRGQFADAGEWSTDPSRPAVVSGTVDMIGSRLLFMGYGIGRGKRPLHAGFLGQDALLVHDEAHLEPAFQELLIAIVAEQERCKENGKFRVMELTATTRRDEKPFELTEAELEQPEEIPVEATLPIHRVWQRLHSKKALVPHAIADEKKDLVPKIVALALAHKESEPSSAVLVFVRTVEAVGEVVAGLKKGKVDPENIETLTGTMRGLERELMASTSKVFARFKADSPAAKQPGTVYLVCTSAGEVGVDMSADHMVCDLSPLDSMAQRFGRVNRYGSGNARIDVVHPATFDIKGKPYESARELTVQLLGKLAKRPDGHSDANPTAVGRLMRSLSEEQRKAAFSPEPTILPVTDILFDAWALTTIKGKLPGRPPVEPYLHGLSDYDPQTTVAWREEVGRLTEGVLRRNKLDFDEVLAAYPLKPHEESSVPTYGKNKGFEQLEAIAKRDAKLAPEDRHSAWVVDSDGSVELFTLQKLVERDSAKKPVVSLGNRTVILPPNAGGLTPEGLLKGDEPFSEDIEYDVSDQWFLDKQRTVKRRERSDDDEPSDPEMREVLHIDIPTSEVNDDAETEPWYWFARPRSADDDGSKNAKRIITWQHHTDDVTNGLVRIATALFPDDADLRNALKVAGKLHDLGKKRIVWQKSIGNPKPTNWHAKSGWDPDLKRKWKSTELTTYRHEFGSLVDLEADGEFGKLSNEMKDLVRHLIAVHHGYGRPHFPEPFDPDHGDTAAIAREVPRRFARLQRRYGRWGLAYLESLLRAADWAASAAPSAFVMEEPR